MSDSNDTQIDNEAADGSGFPRWLKWGLLGALAVLVVGYGAIFLYAKVINDSPDELGQSDLEAALAQDDSDDAGVPDDETEGDAETVEPTGTTAPADEPDSTSTPTTDTTTEPGTTEPATTEPASTAAPADTADPAAAAAGTWEVTDASELGYRVTEVLFGVDTDGVGRTNQITGGLTIDGTQVTDAEFVVDVASISSDDGRRDNQFRGRIMSTDEFPTATFTLTEPIELGTESVDGAVVETTATGELTLRGVTNSVTFDVSAQQTDGRIGVLGNIPVVFADYEIANPSVPGITTEDEGLLEFVLVFEPVG